MANTLEDILRIATEIRNLMQDIRDEPLNDIIDQRIEYTSALAQQTEKMQQMHDALFQHPKEEMAPIGLPGLTPGRMVHYVIAPNEHRPAIVVALSDRDGSGHHFVTLQVFYAPGDVIFMTNLQGSTVGTFRLNLREEMQHGHGFQTAPYDPTGKKIGSWHWIEKA